MNKRRVAIYVFFALLFAMGYLAASVAHHLFTKKPQAEEAPAAKESQQIPPLEQFFNALPFEEISRFDVLYEKRRGELRDAIQAGFQQPNTLSQNKIAQGLGEIDLKIERLSTLTIHSPAQAAVRQSLLSSYQLLKETYEKESEFLKQYPAQSSNVGFITDQIFEISGLDQRSGFQYLSALTAYRKLLATAIRDDQTVTLNQSRMKNLVALNAVIEKYRTLLNVPEEAF